MEKKFTVVRDNTVFKKDEVYTLVNDPLSFEINQVVLKDFPLDSPPPEVIADPGYIIQEIIGRKIDDLSHISDVINLYMEENSEIKKAVVADVRSLPWNDFRKLRQDWLRKANISYISEPPAISNPNTSWYEGPIFPLVPFFDSDYKDLSCFRIIGDDCDDLLDFLKNAKKLSSYILTYLFMGIIYDIERRFYYLIGYHRKKYERSEVYKNGPGQASAAVGKWTLIEAEKVLQAYGGIKGYDTLPRGQKSPVRDKIARAIKDPDGRNVFNVLKKMRKKQEQN